jgi:hypothetical protein
MAAAPGGQYDSIARTFGAMATAPVDEAMIANVVDNLDTIFARCGGAITAAHVPAVNAILNVVAHVASAAAQRLATRLLDHDWHLYRCFASFFDYLVAQRALGGGPAEACLAAILGLCSIPSMKDVIGSTLLNGLCECLAQKDKAATRVEPLALSALIVLSRGSAQSKERIRPKLAAIARFVTTTSHGLAQLQAVELLFRITRGQPEWLDTIGDMTPRLKELVRGLPSNATLLEAALSELHAFNDSANPKVIHTLQISSVNVVTNAPDADAAIGAEIVLARSTVAQLSEQWLTVWLPDQGPGVSIALPLHHVASAKLDRQGRFLLRFSECPTLLQGTAHAGDCLALSLLPDTVRIASAIPLKRWISDARSRQQAECQKLTAATAPGVSNTRGTALDVSPAATSSDALPVQRHQQPPHAPLPPTMSSSAPRPPVSTDVLRPESAKPASPGKRPERPAGLAQPGRDGAVGAKAHMAERNGNVVPGVGGQKSAPTAPRRDADDVFEIPSAIFDANPPSRSGPSHYATAEPIKFERPRASAEPSGPSSINVGDAMAHLKHSVDERVAQHRANASNVLSWALTKIQRDIDACKDANRRDRDEYDVEVTAVLRQLQDEAEELKRFTMARVEELNDSLTEIRGVSEVIRQRIDTLDQRLGVALSAAKQRESDMLHELKRKVDLDIAELERSVMSAADEIDPAKFLHSFMHRR